MVPSQCYGRSIEVWLLYNKLPLFFGSRLYILRLNEEKVLPVPFWKMFTPSGGHHLAPCIQVVKEYFYG